MDGNLMKLSAFLIVLLAWFSKNIKLRRAIRSSLSKGIPHFVTIHNRLSTNACTSVDTFAIVYALFDRVNGCARHHDKVCDITHFVPRTKKCRNFYLIVPLRSHFTIHNNIKPFSSMSQLQSIGWVKQKPDNNCQTTRIVIKSLVQFFLAHSVDVVMKFASIRAIMFLSTP